MGNPHQIYYLRQFGILKRLAIREVSRGYYEKALKCIRYASYLASHYSPGIFYDDAMDACLSFISRQIFSNVDPFPLPIPQGKKIRVGYVLSALWDGGGGHMQTMMRLIENHRREEFDIRVYSAEIWDSEKTGPARMAFLQNQQVPVWRVRHDASYVEKAMLLRKEILKDEIDIAVLIIHPDDVSAVVALSNLPYVVTVYFHHLSVAFNIGVNQFDYHIDYRENFHNFCQVLKPMENRIVIRLPGPGLTAIDSIKPLDRKVAGIPEDVSLSATSSDLFKLFYNDTDIYFQALLRILENNPRHYHLLISRYENENYKARLYKLINDNPVFQKRLILMDRRPEVISLLKSIDLYLESFPLGGGNVCIEAMACGRPVVVLNDLNMNPYSPYPFSVAVTECMAGNPDEYVRLAGNFLHDPGLREKVGKRLRERFETLHDPVLIARTYEDYYRKWCGTKQNKVSDPDKLEEIMKQKEFSHQILDGNFYNCPIGDPLIRENMIRNMAYEFYRKGNLRDYLRYSLYAESIDYAVIKHLIRLNRCRRTLGKVKRFISQKNNNNFPPLQGEG